MLPSANPQTSVTRQEEGEGHRTDQGVRGPSDEPRLEERKGREITESLLSVLTDAIIDFDAGIKKHQEIVYRLMVQKERQQVQPPPPRHGGQQVQQG